MLDRAPVLCLAPLYYQLTSLVATLRGAALRFARSVMAGVLLNRLSRLHDFTTHSQVHQLAQETHFT
jgi:hypothetical protein